MTRVLTRKHYWKLKIFRMYVRAWLPVFLVNRSRPYVNVFDFMAGPGADVAGNAGSPLIILEEAYDYYQRCGVDPTVTFAMHFNDRERRKAEQLKQRVEEFPTDPSWHVNVTSLDFDEAFSQCIPRISDNSSANLVLMDQFGFKHMHPETFASLASCRTTDLMCFVSSSNIRRFVHKPSTQRYVPIPPTKMESVPLTESHRQVCEYYRSLIPTSVDYYVSPFSIRNQASVHGLMFGSSNLLGLEKFLDVCWAIDEFTGEANFAIDDDLIATSPGPLLPYDEYSVPQKQFTASLTTFLSEDHRTNSEIYRFTLESGFLPKHTNALLKSLQNDKRLAVQGLGCTPRKGAFYMSWDHYNKKDPKAVFSIEAASK